MFWCSPTHPHSERDAHRRIPMTRPKPTSAEASFLDLLAKTRTLQVEMDRCLEEGGNFGDALFIGRRVKDLRREVWAVLDNGREHREDLRQEMRTLDRETGFDARHPGWISEYLFGLGLILDG